MRETSRRKSSAPYRTVRGLYFTSEMVAVPMGAAIQDWLPPAVSPLPQSDAFLM